MDTAHDSAQSATATPPSRWTRATEDDTHALRELAASFWYCAYAWWRRSGLDASEAATATVESFTRWLTHSPPRAAHTRGGRMREWLPARLGEMARHGVQPEGTPEIAIDPEWAEQRFADEPAGDADAIFHRRWALTMLEFAMLALRGEYEARGREALFAEVAPFVGFEGGEEQRYTIAAARQGMTAGAMRKAVFEFRKRHRELLRAFVADTLIDPDDTDSEITALLCACDVPGTDAAAAPLPTAIRHFKPDELLARAMHVVQMTHTGAGGQWMPPSEDEITRLFPQYEMRGMLGRGGMGAVYKGRQVALDRFVAIKLLPLEVSVDREFADRFVREARAMAKLNHPNILDVYDFGTTTEGHLYFVMEFVEGANLAEMIHAGTERTASTLSSDQALGITEQVCSALAYAHSKGIVHRDIKPANVMVDLEGTAKVADFGLARLSDPAAEQMAHTVTGTVMGTPDYMAPEQRRGMNVDHRADIYSVGVMLYEMLCKETPQGVFEPPSVRAGCDPSLDQIVIKAMNRDPEKRYQSTQEMQADVEAARVPVPSPARSSMATVKAAKPAAPQVSRAVMHTITPQSSPARKKRNRLMYASLAAAAMAAVALGYHLNQRPQTGLEPVASHDGGPSGRDKSSGGYATATKGTPFVNSLGMKFVPVRISRGATAGQRVLFSVWETRVQDFVAFLDATKTPFPNRPPAEEAPLPMSMVTWEEAQQFCQWLTTSERKAGRISEGEVYRLPSDHEWSTAAGIGDVEDPSQPPAVKSRKIADVYFWGRALPPPPNSGNYRGEEYEKVSAMDFIRGYRDSFLRGAPVGSYPPNGLGLYDIGGNSQEWCEDLFDSANADRVTRDCGWEIAMQNDLLVSCRRYRPVNGRFSSVGFRIVLAPASTAPGTAGSGALVRAASAGTWVDWFDALRKRNLWSSSSWKDHETLVEWVKPAMVVLGVMSRAQAVRVTWSIPATQQPDAYVALRVAQGPNPPQYRFAFHEPGVIRLEWLDGANPKPAVLTTWALPANFSIDTPHAYEFRASGETLTVTVDGQAIGSFTHGSVKQGTAMIWGGPGVGVTELKFVYYD